MKLGYLLMGAGAVGILTLLVLARLELRRILRAARDELHFERDLLGPNEIALELLDLARSAG